MRCGQTGQVGTEGHAGALFGDTMPPPLEVPCSMGKLGGGYLNYKQTCCQKERLGGRGPAQGLGRNEIAAEC